MGKIDVRIELMIQFYNNFYIGGGSGTGMIHSYLLKDVNGLPYIPASTIKGYISQSAGSLVHFFPNINKELLFGRGGTQRGILYFENGKLINEKEYQEMKSSLIDLKTGISISQYTRTNRTGQLYTMETTGQGGTMKYKSQIQGFLSDDKYKEQIAFLVSAVRFIIAIGGKRSTGLGWLTNSIKCDVFLDDEKISAETIDKWVEEAICISN